MTTNIFPILRRELRATFYSPVAWVVLAVYFLSGGYFWAMPMSQYANYCIMGAGRGGEFKFGEWVVSPYFMNQAVMFIFLLPLVSMRLFSEEKKSGTIEVLFTLPFSDLDIVLAKWLGSLTLLAAMLAPTLLYFLLIADKTVMPWALVGTGLLGMFLLGAASLALGVLISACTENQIIAGLLTFIAMLMLFIMNWSAALLSGAPKTLVEELAITGHLQTLANGVVGLKDISFFVLFIVLMLFGTLRVLESKKWR